MYGQAFELKFSNSQTFNSQKFKSVGRLKLNKKRIFVT